MDQPAMPEILLRRIWQGLLFTTDHLKTSDGKAVRILFPGTPNDDAGPDFLNAKIAIGGTQFSGDVELHINAAEWRQHKHDADPHYNRVILHVVLADDPLVPPSRTQSLRQIPLLVLHRYLDEKTFHSWTSPAQDEGRASPPYCRDMNDHVPPEVIEQWIHRLGLQRVELKVRRFEERLKQLAEEARNTVSEPYPRYYGNPAEIPPPTRSVTRKELGQGALWEQLLYEGIMEALGYTKNAKAFLTLARSVKLETLRRFNAAGDSNRVAALLFGAAGLLPADASSGNEEDAAYVTRLCSLWSEMETDFTGRRLNAGDWLFFRLRPNNFPTARLAAFTHVMPVLFGDDALLKVTAPFRDAALTAAERLVEVKNLFAFTPNAYWSRHYHFKAAVEGGGRRGNPIALGAERVNDIITNVILPVMLLYARVFRHGTVGRTARELMGLLPAAQTNSIINAVTKHITKKKVPLSSAVMYQGALQMYRLYCSPLRCLECEIGHRLPSAESGNAAQI